MKIKKKWEGANKKSSGEKVREKKKRRGDEHKREREKKKPKMGFYCSLRSTEIGPWVFVGARGKVGPRNEGYAWVPKSRGFIKL